MALRHDAPTRCLAMMHHYEAASWCIINMLNGYRMTPRPNIVAPWDHTILRSYHHITIVCSYMRICEYMIPWSYDHTSIPLCRHPIQCSYDRSIIRSCRRSSHDDMIDGHTIIGSYHHTIASCDRKVIRTYNHMIIWTQVYIIIWSSHTIILSHEHAILWSYERMSIRSRNHMIAGSCCHTII